MPFLPWTPYLLVEPPVFEVGVGELHFCTGGELYDFAEVFAGVGAGFVGAGGREVLDAGGKCSAYRGDVFGESIPQSP